MASIQKVHQPKSQKPVVKKVEKVQKPVLKKAQMLEAPETLRPEEIQQAQQELGNQVVQRALDKNARQAALTDEQGNLHHEISDQIQQKRGGGTSLPDKVQQEATEKLGRKFNDVRIHTDESADKLSRSLHSRAFTIGKDIFFKNGVFAPGSTAGRETILHELTHVVQQGGKGSQNGKLKLGAPDTAHEKEADRVGKKFSSAVSAGAAHGGTVQAMGEEEEDVIQGQSEEEEDVIQSQSEEEEVIQGQPDNVVQRDDDDEEQPGVPKAPAMTPKMQKEVVLSRAHDKVQELFPPKKPGLGEKLKGSLSSAKRSIQTKATGVDPESLQGQIKATKLKSVKGHGMKDLENTRAAKFKEMQSFSDEPTKEGKLARVPSQAEKKVSSREKLMATISNSSSKPEDVKNAQEKLNMLHKRSKWDTFKSAFKKGGSTKSFADQAMEQRKNNLRKAAEGGDEEAFTKLKEMKADKAKANEEKSKNSTWGKVKGALGGLFGKVGGLVGGQVKSMATDKLKEAKAHYMGPDKKKEDEGEEKDSKKGEKGDEGSEKSSNANAGIGAMMEKYGELVKENMTLKQKIAELEKAK